MKRKTSTKKIRLTTTLSMLREQGACASGYKKLRKHLGVEYPDDKPINLLVILKNNGVQDMLWCIRATVEPYEDHRLHLCGMYADFAESVLPIYERKYPNDERPRNAIEAARSGNRDRAAAAAAAAAYAADAAAAYAAAAAAAYAADAAAAAYAAAYAAAAAADAAADAADAAAARKKEQQKQATIIKRYLK